MTTPTPQVTLLSERREQALIGALLTQPLLVLHLRLRPDDFGHEYAAGIVSWMLERVQAQRVADGGALQMEIAQNAVTELEHHFPRLTEPTDLMRWLMQAEEEAAPVDRAQSLARDLQRLSGRRTFEQGMVQGLTDLRVGKGPDEVVATVLSHYQDAQHGQTPSVVSTSEMARTREDEWKHLERHGARLRTGISAIDRHPDIGGLSMDGVTLILARSSMGKTSVANRFALGVAAQGVPVFVHGSETTVKRRKWDLACSVAGLTMGRLSYLAQRRDRDERAYQEYHHARAKVDKAHAWIESLPIEISGCGKSVDQVCGDILRYRMMGALGAEGEPALILVDYLQDLDEVVKRGMRAGDKGAQVRYASKRLKELQAHPSVQIPLVQFAQVSGEKSADMWDPKKDPRPRHTSCGWASEAHQDAEEVVYLHREDFYTERADEIGQVWEPSYRPGAPGCIEYGLVKRRSGRLCHADLSWNGPAKWVGDMIDGMPEDQVVEEW